MVTGVPLQLKATARAPSTIIGTPPAPTRGLAPLCTFKETERVLAGFPDPRPDGGQGGAGAATLAGLEVANEHNMAAPPAGEGK